MNLAALLASLSLTTEEIQAASEYARYFARAYKLAPTWNAFQQLFRFPGLGNIQKSLGIIFRAGRYFANQGTNLSHLPSDQVIDWRMAETAPFPASRPDASMPYQYGVDIYTYSPGEQLRKFYHYWVESRTLLSRQEAMQRALIKHAAMMMRYYKQDWTLDETPESKDTISLTSFTHFHQ